MHKRRIFPAQLPANKAQTLPHLPVIIRAKPWNLVNLTESTR